MRVHSIPFIVILFAFIDFNIDGQIPIIQWQKTYGGSMDDIAYSTCNIINGGYLVIGEDNSNDGNVRCHKGSADVWLLKLDSLGNLNWNKCFGGSGIDYGNSIIEVADGGFAFAASTTSDDGDVSGLHGLGLNDFWVVKTNNLGIITWQKCLGSTEFDEPHEIIQAKDSGYLVTGFVSWSGGDVTGFHGIEDMWVVKLDKNGTKQWTKSLGGSDDDWGSSCIQTRDGGYLIAGSTASVNGDVVGQHGTGVDAWVVKLNSLGQIEWQKCYGGSGIENANKIISANDGGFFVSATTSSSDGDVTDYHGGGSHGLSDYWVCKVDSVGNFQWGKSLGGSDYEYPYSIQQTPDGGYLAAGSTTSMDGDITSNHGMEDYWVVKLAPLGLSVPEFDNSLMELKILQTNDQVNLRFFSKKNENAQLYLYNINGKKVFEKNVLINEGINYNSINCSGYVKGLYFVKIDGVKGWLSEKIFIE